MLKDGDVEETGVEPVVLCESDPTSSRKNEKKRKKIKKKVEPKSETVACDVCAKAFEYINSLIRHRKQLHPEHPVFLCTLCGFQSNVFAEYKQHIRSHRDRVQLSISCLICDICGKEFLCHYNLVNHRKYHMAPKYPCSHCPKMFKSKPAARHHERIHTGENPFTCETCGKSFPGKNYLINHQKSHSDQKEFVCDVCEKAFGKKWNLVQHERIHTGERPYRCQLCGRSFMQNFLLKNHLKKAHQRDWRDLLKPQKRYHLETFPPE